MNAKQAKRIAINYLSARRTSRGYRYHDCGTQSEWVSPVRDLVRLGRMLRAQDGEFGHDAYSRWCSQTVAREVRS